MVTTTEKSDKDSTPGPGHMSYVPSAPPGYSVDAPAVLEVPSYQPPTPASFPNQSQATTASMPEEHITVVIGRAKEYKSLMEAYILWFPLGFFGLHHFYLKRPEMGLIYIFTMGLCGVGWLIDGFRMSCLVKAANKKIDHPSEYEPLTITDAYVLWFPLGIIGFHHYYLRQPAWGILYTFTLGLFGVGWLIDAFRIPCMVHNANIRLEREHQNIAPKYVHLCDAYVLGATPLGLFGTHHFYMGRYSFGLFYLFTLGGCGIGWMADWFRMKWLVERTNNVSKTPLGRRHKYIDDAYILAFPLGFLGTHHFYLERPGWGVLYLFTAGLGGIGWLFDLVRMPCLVKETNRRLEEELGIIEKIQQQIGTAHCRINTADIIVAQNGAGAEAAAATSSTVHPVASNDETGVINQGWTGPPFVNQIMAAPPSYVATVGGYSNYGHVYTLPAPGYMYPSPGYPPYYPPGPSAPQYPGPFAGHLQDQAALVAGYTAAGAAGGHHESGEITGGLEKLPVKGDDN